MKKKIFIYLCALIALMLFSVTAYAQEAKISVNGEIIQTETAPINIDGRILVPIRDVGEALQCDVWWNDANKGVSVSDRDNIVIMWIGRDAMFKFSDLAMDSGYISDVAPQLIDGKTMLPIRCISELLGAKVDWIDESKTVTIEYTPNPAESGQELTEFGDLFIYYLSGDYYDIYRDYIGPRENVVKAEIELSDGKIIKLDLFPDIAPITVANFKNLAVAGAFDNKIFHRVIEDFMIQGGAFGTDGSYFSNIPTITGEFFSNNIINFLPHKRGAISMARTNQPNSATCQFFIVHKNSPFLNTQYASFGEVTDGMEYVDEIAETKTDDNDRPIEDCIIKTVRILTEI